MCDAATWLQQENGAARVQQPAQTTQAGRYRVSRALQVHEWIPEEPPEPGPEFRI